MRRKVACQGMTLVEMIVVLALTSIFLVSAISLMAASARSLSFAQSVGGSVTDAAVAARVLQWDLSMVGYGIPLNLYATFPPLEIFDNVNARSDSLVIRGVNLGVEPQQGKWSVVVEGSFVPTNRVLVLRWNHPFRDFAPGDEILLMVGVGEGSLEAARFDVAVVQSAVPQTWTDPRSGSVWDVLELTLDRYLTPITGMVAYGSSGVLTATYVLDPVNNRLLRNGEVFMEGVYAFQVQVWVDANGNGVEEPGEWRDDLQNPSSGDLRNTRRIRIQALVLRGFTRRRGDSPVPPTVALGNVNVNIPAPLRSENFADILEVQVAPKNLAKKEASS